MSTAVDRTRIAQSILNFEARRKNGKLAVYILPEWDGGGAFEVAGINVRYHPEEAFRLRQLVEAGRHDQAEKEACEYIALYTDFVASWTRVTAIESYLRDCSFNRGPRGAARILQRALGVEEDGYVGTQTVNALRAAETNPRAFLKQLREKRESYERNPVGRSETDDPPWAGLVNRWNKALEVAKSFLAAAVVAADLARAREVVAAEEIAGAAEVEGAAQAIADAAPPGGFSAAESATSNLMSADGTSGREGAAPLFEVAGPPAAIPAAPVELAETPSIHIRPVAIPALRIGSRGPLVRAWQTFLLGQQLDPGGNDGEFGDKTHAATLAFQTREGLEADGIAGRQTIMRAMALGFELIEEPAADITGSNFPPRPDFPPLEGTAGRQAVFGAFNFVSRPVPRNREAIQILGNWVAQNIVTVPIPQLRKAIGPNAPTGMQFHRRAAVQLAGLWAEWEAANLLNRIVSFEGSFVPRFIRGSSSVLSNHAFGSAFDINALQNGLGVRPALVGQDGAVRELVPAANKWGFYWGGHFGSRPDGMHFEIAFLK